MKYLKRFNEGNITPELTTEMVDELRSFCRDHLAYLIDEDFKVQVVPLFNGTSCDISFFKEEKLSNFNSYDSEVDWSSIKDHFIPFLYMLNKEYRIIQSPDDDSTNRVRFVIQPHQVERIISEKAYPSKIERLRIRVEFKDQSITESVTQDDIELCCVDLFDDGFELVSFEEDTKIVIRKIITSNFGSSYADSITSVIGEHLEKYKDRAVYLSGSNFDHISKLPINRNVQVDFTAEEQELIDKVANVAILLNHFNKNKEAANRVYIDINNRGIQNPMNFQYERFQTQIEVTFYL
jgi:hypothetical protein